VISLHSTATWRPLAAGLLLTCACAVTAGCGGGGGTAAAPAPTAPTPPDSWTPGTFAQAAEYKGLCASPRDGTDPETGLPFGDVQGTSTDENNWLRSWSHETYLWYDEIVDRNPALFTTPAYFDLLKTEATTPSGQARDRFHFSMPTEEWRLMSTTGAGAGYGAQWAILSAEPPREVVVAYTEPDSPASDATIALTRGTRVLEIDGIDIVSTDDQAGIAALNAGLSPAAAGETHEFTVLDPGSTVPRTVAMTSAIVESDPVPTVDWFDTATGRVGYLLFSSHIATAEAALIDAVQALDSAGPDESGIDDLILDVRYNGGGFLLIASQLAYMIAGQTATAGRTFELTQFNDKHPDVNPVTGDALEPLPFIDVGIGYAEPIAGQPLPTLALDRVFVLTGPGTCSASESIINALEGIGVRVIQIGATTCGKPYGFYPTENCGTTYFSIQFQGVNDAGFGDYTDGFSPVDTPGPASTVLPGCAVADDYDHALGDPAEGRIAAALDYRDFGTCPEPAGLAAGVALKPGGQAAIDTTTLIRPPGRQMRWLGGPAR
jgi:hypothetical protein